MKRNAVIVIGAGIGGITAAIHLARNGRKVIVLEKNDKPGGRCDRLSKDGHHFDTGPTLLVMPLIYESEFNALGCSMHDLLELIPVDPTYHLFFEDGSRLSLTSEMRAMRDQLEQFEPGSFQGFLRYMDEGYRHYHLGMEKLVYPDFKKPTDFFKLSNLPLLYQVKPLAKHYANMSAYFDSPKLKAAFTFQDVYMGLSPFEAPATFSMMPYTELAHGVWYPKGGMYQIVKALVQLALEAGVEFLYNSPVEEIMLSGKRATGVRLKNGHVHKADAVLANADLPYVYQKLLPSNGRVEKLKRSRYSCSVISFFWGVDKTYAHLPPHALFMADDYRQNFETINQDLGLAVDSSLYVHAPARLDPGMAPPGQDTLIGIVPVGHMSGNGDQDWIVMRDQARQQIFHRLQDLGVTDLADHIKFEINFTPLSWRKRYNLVKGSTHGLCHNLAQLGIFRPDFQPTEYQQLYFVGASTRPGTGLPTAMISGRQAAGRILG